MNKLGVVDLPLATPQRDKIVLMYLNITSSKIINARLMYDRQWTAIWSLFNHETWELKDRSCCTTMACTDTHNFFSYHFVLTRKSSVERTSQDTHENKDLFPLRRADEHNKPFVTVVRCENVSSRALPASATSCKDYLGLCFIHCCARNVSQSL